MVHLLFAVVIGTVIVDHVKCSLYPEVYIVGGGRVTIEAYPYQVWYSVNDHHSCGGAIISENYILTAAHCLWEPLTVDVRAGSIDYNKGYTSIPIASYKIHPQYEVGALDFDVAVFKTKEPIEFTDSIKAIGLPEKNRPMEERTLIIVSGWGKLSEDGEESQDLQAVDIPVITSEECQDLYENFTNITENMWCAMSPFGGKDACQGDSGGPAVQDDMVVGIVSFGYGCAREDKPGVYANVAAPHIRNFINSYTGL